MFTSYNFYLVVLITSVVSIMFSTVVDISRVYFFPTQLDTVKKELRAKGRRHTLQVAGINSKGQGEKRAEVELEMVSIKSTKPSQLSYR